MKILFRLTPGTKAEPVVDAAGKIIGFSIEPFFHARRGRSTFALGHSASNTNPEIDPFALTVSGSTGSVGIGRTEYKSVVPFIDLPAEEAAKAEAAAAKGEEDEEGEDEEQA